MGNDNNNDNTDRPSDFHVLIIGAGCTGLIVAHGLRKAGIGSTVFEAEPENSHRPREWSMGIHWSLPLLENLLPKDLFTRLNEVQNDPSLGADPQDEFPIYNGLTGEVMLAIPAPNMIRVSRRKFRAFLCQGIDYGKCLSEIIYGLNGVGVTAVFADGERITGTVLVGCDGPRSSVRELLLGPEKAAVRPLGVVLAQVSGCYNDGEKAKFVRTPNPLNSFAIHPECICFLSVQDVPDPEQPEGWRFAINTLWLGKQDKTLDASGRLVQLKEKASLLAEPFRSAVLWMPEGTPVSNDEVSYWATIPWNNREGRVTLAGDAAHPMSPTRGQGLNHAICSASNFVAALEKVRRGETKMRNAITSYDEEVVKRGGEEVVASRENSMMMLNWQRVMDSPLFKKGIGRS